MTTPDIARSLDHSVGFQLNRVAQLFRRELLQVLGCEGIQPEQWQVLVALADAKCPLTQQQITRLVLSDKHTASRMLARMERDGWVRRGPHPTDARSQYVSLTKKARGRYPQLLAALRSHFQVILGQLPEHDTRELMRLLQSLRHALKDIP